MHPSRFPLGFRIQIPVSFWRFSLVGFAGLLFDVVILYLGLLGLGLSKYLAKVVSFLATATFTWWLNRLYTFGKSDKSMLSEWASFLATNAFGGFVNVSVYSVIMLQNMPYVWMPAAATVLGSVCGLFFNYLSSKHLVFSRRGAGPNDN